MDLMQLRIKDKACTICDGIYPSGRAKSKKRCDTCKDGKNWNLAEEYVSELYHQE